MQRQPTATAEKQEANLDRASGALAAGASPPLSAVTGPSSLSDSAPAAPGAPDASGLDVAGIFVRDVGAAPDLVSAEVARRKWRRARKERQQADDAAAQHAADRDARTGLGDFAEKTGAAGGKVARVVGDAVKTGVSGPANVGLGITGAAVGLPAQLVSLTRSARKLIKQGGRYHRLKTLQLTTFQDPSELVRAAHRDRSEVEGALALLSIELQRLQGERDRTQDVAWSAELADAEDTRTLLEGRLRIRTAQVAEAEQEKSKADAVKERIAARFPGATTAPTLTEIAEYAKAKQRRGLIKKTIASLGSTIGLTGSAIALAVAIGAGAGLALTPVGWGLAALAAAIGIGVAGYKAIQRFRKFAAERRRTAEESGTERTRGDKVRDFGRNLRDALNPRKAAPSERTAYAEALLDYFTTGTADQKEEARAVIIALLGLETSKRRAERLVAMTEPSRRDKYVKLLAAKMGS